MPKFRIVLKDPTSEHRRFVTLSRVTCPTCLNDPIARGGFLLNAESGLTMPACRECDGRGDVPATRESAAAHLETMEREYAKFRLDETDTIAKYPALREVMAMGLDPLWLTKQHTEYHPKDSVLVDGRFVRGGKTVRRDPDEPEAGRYFPAIRGWGAFHEQEEPYKVMEVGDTRLVAAVTGFAYGVPAKNQWDGTAVTDWDTDTIKQSLHTSYTVDIDTHDFFNDVSGSEVTGTNYTAGGATLGSKTVTYDTASDQSRCDAADTTWASSTISATDAITYKSTGTASTSPLITSLDFGATVSTTAGTFQITHDATGIRVEDCT